MSDCVKVQYCAGASPHVKITSREIPLEVKHEMTSQASILAPNQEDQIELANEQGNQIPIEEGVIPLTNHVHKLVGIIMGLLGVATLVPWDYFVYNLDYFQILKLKEDEWYSAEFFNYMALSSLLPTVIFNWVNFLWSSSTDLNSNLRKRIIIALLVEVSVCIFTAVLAAVDTSEWSIQVFFWLTIASVLIMNIAGGIFQNAIYGEASRLKYTTVLLTGSNFSGTVIAITKIMALSTSISPQTSAITYFCIVTLIMVICFIAYLGLPYLKYYQDLLLQNQDNQAVPEQNLWHIGKQCWLQCFNLFMTFFVTLSVFPAVVGNIKKFGPNFIISDDRYFSPVTCFFTFSLCAFFGNVSAELIQRRKVMKEQGQAKHVGLIEKFLWIPVTLRVLIIPAFLYCNYHPIGFTRNVDTVVFGDTFYWIFVAVHGLTCGFFGSSAMAYCSKSVSGKRNQQRAGMLGTAIMVTGVLSGVIFSWAMPYITKPNVR